MSKWGTEHDLNSCFCIQQCTMLEVVGLVICASSNKDIFSELPDSMK